MRGGRRARPLLARSLISMRKCLDDHRDIVSGAKLLTRQDLEHTMQLLEEARTCLDSLSESLHAAMVVTDGYSSDEIDLRREYASDAGHAFDVSRRFNNSEVANDEPGDIHE